MTIFHVVLGIACFIVAFFSGYVIGKSKGWIAGFEACAKLYDQKISKTE
jgi:hypothetical protein